MRTGTGQLIGVVLALSLTPAWAVDPAPPAAPGSPDYVVQKGDTLWGIAKQLLEDPLLWPRLWEENPSIKNPNLIFPGERLAVPGKTLEAVPAPAAQLAPSPAPTPPPAPAPPVVAAPPAPPPPAVPLVNPFTVNCSPVVTSEEAAMTKGLGSIIESREGLLMLSRENRVHVGLTVPEPVAAGALLAVVRPAQQLVDPDTGRVVGRVLFVLGVLEVTASEGQVAQARVAYACGAMTVGDRVIPFRLASFPPGKTFQRARQAVEGFVLGSTFDTILLGQMQTVFLSPNTVQGVLPGDLFAVYRIKPPMYNAAGAIVAIPPERLGEVLVLRVTDQGSTALIMQSAQAFAVGDRVVLSQQLAP